MSDVRIIYYLHKEVRLEKTEDKINIVLPVGDIAIPFTEVTWKAFQIIEKKGATESELADFIADEGEIFQLSSFLYYLHSLTRLGVLTVSAGVNSENFAKLIACSLLFKFERSEINPEQLFIFSKFAFLRKKYKFFVIESPLAYAYIELYDKCAFEIIGMLSSAISLNDLKEKNKHIPADIIEGFLILLHNIKAITEVNEKAVGKEDANETLMQWEFHDLLFHSRSRMGRHNNPSGASYPFLGKIEPEPALKQKPTGERTLLFKPDIDELIKSDISFTSVLEKRKSIRAYSSIITAKQLGEFLYRTARLRKLNPFNKETEHYETSDRPYPNGGASYELELYITVNECEGIGRGIYYYDPKDHELILISTDENYVASLINDAWQSAAQTVKPQVLITMASRFHRLNWKYRSIGYSASLKNTGVLYQTMYLVATAMNLAPCGLGNGNAELFSKAVDSDYLVESSVGEFMLGVA